MLILGKPNDDIIDKFICINDISVGMKLHELGFLPSYRNMVNGNLYFTKTDNILKTIKEMGVTNGYNS